MFLSILLPFADSRFFLPGKVNLLGRPLWPSASPDIDFVRSFGSIRKRKLGGLSGWIGEGAICEANRALRFSRLNRFRDTESGIEIPISLSFRRFYFDGQAVGKFEVGLATPDLPKLNRKQTGDLIKHFLELPVLIPALSPKAVAPELAGPPAQTVLAAAGSTLARFYAACSISHPPPVTLEPWWVKSGTPLLFLVYKEEEKVNLPYFGKQVPQDEFEDSSLSYYEVPFRGRDLRMWAVRLSPFARYRNIRELKICLLRLHAEHEAMRIILENIATNKIDVQAGADASQTLQRYLNEATRRISRLGSQADRLSAGDLSELARESEDLMNPGERDALLDTLNNLNVRRNIFAKVKEYLNEGVYIKELYMDSKYKITGGTQGAVGDNAVNYGNIYSQWKQEGGDLSALATELATLRAELGKKASQASDYEAAASIAKAEDAAKKDEGSTVFEHLRNAGKWAYEVALSVGVPAAVEALKKALGF
ncbi:MAG TPA: hypothetical protein VE642_02810 [Pyrinomonadaceae bacterium]|jgi:hypothetical protein|nr:hypothetical protein [Pyrinomonadaceae bacterium]